VNPKLLPSLGEKLAHLERMQAHLDYSLSSVRAWWNPAVEFDALSPQQLVELVAFKARFAEMQDHLAAAMRLVTDIEEEPTGMFTYVLNYMAKLGVLDSIEAWREVRELRNAATHDYSSSEADKALHFQQLLQSAAYLTQTFANLKRIAKTAYPEI
jgi:hypothetical protein